MRSFAALGLALALCAPVAAQETTWVYAVQLGATVHSDPARVELTWTQDHLPIAGTTVQRKAPGDGAWSPGVTLDGGVTSFVDEQVAPGQTYEYQVTTRGATYPFTGYGYASVGVQAPLVHERGRVILVLERSVAAALAGGIARWEQDLVGEGWAVARVEADRDEAPAAVKAKIRTAYEQDRARTRSVVLFGHVPVVRSGNLNVDGHGARPMPADVFYADLDGTWTDANGDGIYDQSVLPSDVELELGRIDFANLPGTYAATPYPDEIEFLRRYLDKNHAYRNALVRPAQRAVIAGMSDANGQAYAASGYRNFAVLVGRDQISRADTAAWTPPADRWIGKLVQDDHVWSFGFGAGSDLTVSGLGTHGPYNELWSSDFLDLQPRGTFYLLFGSWFADWAQSDNLLRSALTGPSGLAAAWSGRPHLYFHSMGSGETLGHGIRLSQNNDGTLYQNQANRQLRGVHIALLGDPTLRQHVVAPPADATAQIAGGDVSVSWRPSPDAVLGYHVYRAPAEHAGFTRLTAEPIDGTRFLDSGQAGRGATYLVRAVTLHTGPSGTYYNASRGAFATIGGVSGTPPINPGRTVTKPNDVIWFDDSLPPGAIADATPNDSWRWVGDNPSPFSGVLSHVANNSPGLHFHYFHGAQPLSIRAGETLFAYVYLDPNNPPRMVMLTWLGEGWEHRAYWGENLSNEGVEGGPGRRYVGPLPPTGRWVRLEVPASAVGLEGRNVTGMGFNLYDGSAAWDLAGKETP